MSTHPGSGSQPGGQPPAAANLVGRRLGRYEIVSWLASGGMANVYVARALGVGGFERLVALKLLHPHLAHEHEFISMFLDEARLAARIRHPNVVATLDISSTETEGLYLVMEFVEGQHLGRLLSGAARQGLRLPAGVVLRIVADALQGLGAAHDLTDAAGTPLQLVHRDVSPHNVLVGVDGIARLTDFGVARAEVRLSSTRDGQFKGKLGYLAPEQVSAGRCDRRSDLFAMGVLAWEALAGRRLFRGDDTVGMLRAVLQQPIPPISTQRPELEPLDPVLQQALARDPEARFPHAAAFLEALERAAPQVGGLALARDVGEAVRRFAPPGAAHHVPTAIHPAALQASGIHAAPPPLVGTHPGTPTPPLLARSHPGASWPGTGAAWHPAAGSQPGAAWAGTHPGTGWPTPPAAPPPRRRAGLLAGVAALVVVAGLAAAFLAGRSRAEIPPVVATAVAQPLDADQLTGDGDAAPRLLEGATPESPNPDLALTPTIVLRLHVDAAGHVAEAQVYRSRLELQAFEEVALEAARSFRFAPARKAGRTVPAWLNWPVTFARSPTPATVLRMKGSDTIGEALAPDLARAYRRKHPLVAVQVEANGSSTGFAGLFDGTADIAASSRAVSAAEIAQAARLGLQLREFVIGYDGVAVIVHPGNPVRNLTAAQLSRIFTGQLRNWRDLGGPDAPIEPIGRPADSGTHAFFREKVLRRGDPKGPEEFAPDVLTLEHNSEIVERVSARRYAISYVGLGAVTEAVRVVPVAAAPGQMAVAPSRDAVANGTYPIYRPLLLYTGGAPEGDTLRFLRFVLSAEGRGIVEAHGFVPSDVPVEAVLPADQLSGTASSQR